MRWLTYARDSGGARQEASVDQQTAEYDRWIEARGDTLALPHFCDRARPGGTMVGRDDLDRLLAVAERTPRVADGILFWAVNRVGRNTVESDYIRATLRYQGFVVTYISSRASEALGKVGRIIEQAEVVEAESFNEKLSADVKRGQRYMLNMRGPDGKYLGINFSHNVPPGFKAEQIKVSTRRDGRPHMVTRWVVDETTARVVREAFQARAEGMTLPEIQELFPLYRNASSYNSLHAMFRNPVYKGVMKRGDIEIEDYWPAIVDADTWAKACALRRPVGPRTAMSKRLLLDLLVCGECGYRVSIMTNENYVYYHCPGRWRGRECHNGNQRAVTLEAKILAEVDKHLSPEEIEVYDKAAKANNARIQSIQDVAQAERQARLAVVEGTIANITKTLVNMPLSEALGAELMAMEREKAELTAQIAAFAVLPPKLAPVGADLLKARAEMQEKLKDGNIPAARRALKRLIARIVMTREEQRIEWV